MIQRAGMAAMHRAKRPVEWFRKVWSLPTGLLWRALLYAGVATTGIGLALPSIARGELTMLALWLLGPLFVMLFAGLNDIGELPPEQQYRSTRSAIQPDTVLAGGFGALLVLTLFLGIKDIAELASYSIFFLLLPIFAALFVLIGSGLILRPLLRARSAEIGVDEAGVRLQRKGASGYLPFTLLGDARIVRRGLLPWLILRDRTGRALEEVPLLGAVARERGEQLAEHIQQGIASAEPTVQTPPELRRGHRPMRQWLADVRQLVSAARGDTYRVRVSEDQVLATLDDAAAPVDAGAAAAHALLAEGSPRVRVEVRQRIGPASPPLVQLAARLSEEGRELVDDEDLSDALASFDSVDHAEAVELLGASADASHSPVIPRS